VEAGGGSQLRPLGLWEGGVLVVDTVQFTEHPQGIGPSLPSGPRKHLVERFALTEDRKRLRYETLVEDPDYLAAPIRDTIEWDYRPDLVLTDLPCDLEAARRFLTQ
jgi:hypothetical protein